jgi:hypothetical protein
MLDLLCHRGLIRDTLDQLRVEQLVFALVMMAQRRDAEVDVIGQERDPPGDGAGAARTRRADSS